MIKELILKFLEKSVVSRTKSGATLTGTLTFLPGNNDYVLVKSKIFEDCSYFETIIALKDIEFIRSIKQEGKTSS